MGTLTIYFLINVWGYYYYAGGAAVIATPRCLMCLRAQGAAHVEPFREPTLRLAASLAANIAPHESVELMFGDTFSPQQ